MKLMPFVGSANFKIFTGQENADLLQKGLKVLGISPLQKPDFNKGNITIWARFDYEAALELIRKFEKPRLEVIIMRMGQQEPKPPSPETPRRSRSKPRP